MENMPMTSRYLAVLSCAAAIASFAACGDGRVLPSAPSPLALSGSGGSLSVVGGADYHDGYPPYPDPSPAPDPGMPPAAPAFTIDPDVGPATGGTSITISGMNVVAGATVTFGGQA